MEWLAAILGAIPIIGKVLVKILDLLTSIPSILKAIPQIIWDAIAYAIKWVFKFIDSLITNPLGSLYERLFRIMDIAIDLLEKEFILIGKVLEKKVDDFLKKGETRSERSDLPFKYVIIDWLSKLFLKCAAWLNSKKHFRQNNHHSQYPLGFFCTNSISY